MSILKPDQPKTIGSTINTKSIQTADLILKMNGFLDEKTVATITGLSRTERYRMRLCGTFPDMKTIKGKVKGWRAHDIQDWLNEQG